MTTSDEVMAKVRDAFARLSPDREGDGAVSELIDAYDDEVVFQDPLQRVEGREALAEMNRRLLRRARVLRVTVNEGVAAGDQIFLTWTMEYAYRLSPTLTLEGASHLRVRDGKIVYHRDYWDLASSLIGKVPGVRRLYGALTARMA